MKGLKELDVAGQQRRFSDMAGARQQIQMGFCHICFIVI
jgi:hypothetical protein